MIPLKLQAVKGMFFDAPLVMQRVDRARRAQLSRFGAFVRTRAISSQLRHVVRGKFGVRSRVSNDEGISAPGEPPFVHEGGIVRNIFFAYDEENKSVLVGPILLNRGTGAPHRLEFGGEGLLMDRGQTRRAYWRKRPFMRPAMEAEQDQLPGLFAGEVK